MLYPRQTAAALRQNAHTRSYDPTFSQEPPTPATVFFRIAATLAIGLAVALLGNAYASLAMH